MVYCVKTKALRSMLLLVVCATMVKRGKTKYHHPSHIHQRMNKKELSRYFGVDNHEEVPEYDIAHPAKVTDKGHFLSHQLSEDDIQGTTDNGDGVESRLHYNISAFGTHFNLHLKKNHKLLAPNMAVEVLGHKGRVLRRDTVRNCFYHGHSKNHHKSTAALSNCENLVGAIDVADQSYFIQPLPGHLVERNARSNDQGVPHIIYKTVSGKKEIQRRSLTGGRKETSFCGTDDDPKIRYSRSSDIDSDSTSGDDTKDPERYIETLVVVDEKMCDFHGEDAAKQFSLAACNIASGLLKDSTIGSNPINLVITKMQIHTTPQEGLVVNHHARNTLQSFGEWSKRNTVPDDSDPQHYDYATLFTRYDICKDKNQPCDTLGVSNVGGMCQFPNSVSICEDNGLMVGKTLAHETGHALGMNHDVRPFCGDSNKMMSLHPEGSEAYAWSKCSRMFLQEFLASRNSHCLEDQPTSKRAINIQMFNEPGLLYDADQQCELAYGDGAKYCTEKSSEDTCSQLRCSIPSDKRSNCRSLNQPLAEGTRCGKQKWCKRGKCVAKFSEGPEAIDGGWSSWSNDYTECTRTCSSGVKYRTRQCNNPLATNGGKFCEGEHREYKLCNTQACEDERNFRDVQCEKRNEEMFNDKFFQWEWRPSNLQSKCTLGCFIKKSDQGFAFGNVEDGTNCDEDGDGKCVDGECVHVGCDDVIGSSSKLDRCGVCNGDGSTCQFGNSSNEALKTSLTEKYKEQGQTFKKTLSLLNKMGYDDPGDHASADKDDVISEFFWAVVKTGCSATCGGGTEMSKSECRRSDDASPVADGNCDVKKKPTEETIRCNIKACDPEWRTDRWADCSKTCNGGERTRRIRCVQLVEAEIEYDVEDEMCDQETKPRTKEDCNKQECNPEWVAQPFGVCSTNCGRGVQKRKIMCQKINKDGDAVDMDAEKCSDLIKPSSEEYCNVHNPCPGEGDCGGIYQRNDGYLTSPGFPDRYPNGKECMHSIIVPEDKIVKLMFKSFELTGSANSAADGTCTGDFVRVTDGDCNKGRAETHYCGNSNIAPFLSTGNKLCLKFYSDESLRSKGFNASFEAIDRPARPKDICDSLITATFGLLASPNYPEPYPSNEVCNTTIKTVEGPIRLHFQYFDVGKDKNCDEDYLMLQGDSEATKLCGSNLPEIYNVNGTTLRLSFTSGQQKHNKLGFVAMYTSGKALLESQATKKTEQTNSSETNSHPASNSKQRTASPGKNLADIVRDTIPHASRGKSLVQFIPISPKSIDSKEVSKEEVSGRSKKAVKSAPHQNITANTTNASKMPLVSTGVPVAVKSAPANVTTSTTKNSKNVSTSVPVAVKSTPANVTTSTTKNSKNVSTSDKNQKRQNVLRPLQSVLEQNGALVTRGQCPHQSRLSCINLLYSYPCASLNDNACQLRGMDCCPTSCAYGPNMCVPKVWRECPLLTPYTSQTLNTCTTSADCQQYSICCIDMLGRRYCHRRKETDK